MRPRLGLNDEPERVSPDAAPRLGVVIGSTRPGRVGAAIGSWTAREAADHGAFAVSTIDLKEIALPMFDEPHHPRSQNYVHDHTLRWSQLIQSMDALVFVIPEYNHTFNAASKNAVDYLFLEWRDKPSGVVSYGGASGGSRAAQHFKSLLLSVGASPASPAVAVPFVNQLIVDGTFVATPELSGGARRMLDEVERLRLRVA